MRWYYGWNVLAAAISFQAITYGIGFYSFAFFADAWVKEFDAGRGEVMFTVTAATLALGALGPFVGRALDRFSIRLLVCGGGLCFSLGLALVSQATELWHVVIIYTIVIAGGLTLAGALPAQTLAAKWFRGRRGLALGLVSIGTSVGGFLLPPLTTFLIETADWRSASLFLAGLSALAILPLTWFVVRNGPSDIGLDAEPESTKSEQLSATFAGQVWTSATILRERAFWITFIAFLPIASAFGSIQHNLALYTGDLGIDPQEASFLMSVIAGTMVAGKLAFGALADRIDTRYLYWAAASSMMIALVLLMQQPGYGLLLVICTFLGLSAGGNLPLLGSIVSTRFGPNAFGQVMGLLTPFLTLSALAPMATGWVRDVAGSYEPAFIAFMIFLVPAALAMSLLPKSGDAPAPNAVQSSA